MVSILFLLMFIPGCFHGEKLPETYRDSSGQQNGGGLDELWNSGANFADISGDPWTFESESMPVNERLNPSVGNGHLATNIYRDSVFVNNLYSGYEGFSHRARIPSVHSSRFSFPDDECGNPTRRYKLDLKNGAFEETMSVPGGTVVYRVFAHQYFNRLLVTSVTVERNQSSSCGPCCSQDITFTREDLGSNETRDFIMGNKGALNCGNELKCWSQNGTITITETNTSARSSVFTFWNEMESTYTLEAGTDKAEWTYVLSADQQAEVAEADFNQALQFLHVGDHEGLYQNHTSYFNAIWDKGNIDILGDLQLQKVVHGCLYYIYSSLPAHPTHSPSNPFGGLSPGGLANGANNSDYQGHVFWDMETWMYPGVLMFRPDLAKDMLAYRIDRMDPAFERASQGGHQGTRFPWESAFTGDEVTPGEICMACRENQIHITGDIALAARQFVSATMDLEWMKNPQANTDYTGLDFLLQMANFWYTRPIYNEAKKVYEIDGVMPPDEHQQSVNNSIYTNLAASYAIHFAKYAHCLAGADVDQVPKSWIEVAQNLSFTYNAVKRYHEEFEGYDEEIETNMTDPRGIKQADVVMLGFPFQWEMPDDVRVNDLNLYDSVTHPNGPAMTWGIFAIGWLDLGDVPKADELFDRAYSPYVREPFKIWTEVQSGDGAVNFITGMGGFLQSIIFGYGGFRLHENRLEIKKPVVPPKAETVIFRNLDYLETQFDMEYDGVSMTFKVLEVGSHLLTLRTTVPEEEFILEPGFEQTFNLQNMEIFAVNLPACSFDTPIINVDYSPVADSTRPRHVKSNSIHRRSRR